MRVVLGLTLWTLFRKIKFVFVLVTDLSKQEVQAIAFIFLCTLCLHTEKSRDVSIQGMAFSSSQGKMEEQQELISWVLLCTENTGGEGWREDTGQLQLGKLLGPLDTMDFLSV